MRPEPRLSYLRPGTKLSTHTTGDRWLKEKRAINKCLGPADKEVEARKYAA